MSDFATKAASFLLENMIVFVDLTRCCLTCSFKGLLIFGFLDPDWLVSRS